MSEDPVPRFIADDHLGRLARYLRLLGFDTIYQPPQADDWLMHLAKDESRVLLSKDRELIARLGPTHAWLVRSQRPKDQLQEILGEFKLHGETRIFSRCLDCNGVIGPVKDEEVLKSIQGQTRQWYTSFFQCSECGKVYWKGGHYDRMRKWASEIVEAPNFVL